ncbi:hypothetical protein Nepgr_027013 [Nepenthes gracilis]|uniref:Uncharacterized protein n=1 Tax=Nepenthes gracilis TaxID=150966 RepID=A0AAD3Y2K3_NEPGR|nr:hypothetical protein Nepgr_027013 [Nepenthes gracilis]
MYASILHPQISKPSTKTPLQISTQIHHHQLRQPPRIRPVRSSSGGGNGRGNPGSDGGNSPTPAPAPPSLRPPDAVELRFRRGLKRRQRKQREEEGVNPKRELAAPAAVKKSWEEMTIAEKAVELYMGEKGLLFWLNKFAYASIFIVVGGWIFFRFVGPALNLYQLEAPPASPAAMFKGS